MLTPKLLKLKEHFAKPRIFRGKDGKSTFSAVPSGKCKTPGLCSTCGAHGKDTNPSSATKGATVNCEGK